MSITPDAIYSLTPNSRLTCSLSSFFKALPPEFLVVESTILMPLSSLLYFANLLVIKLNTSYSNNLAPLTTQVLSTQEYKVA